MAGFLTKGPCEEAETRRVKTAVGKPAERGDKLSKAKDSLGPPETGRRRRKIVSQRLWREHDPASILFQASPPEL